MAYNEFLADRLKQALNQKRVSFSEKKMMGGLAFMVDDKMCLGIIKDNLMVRTDPENEHEPLSRKGCRPMDFTGKRMKGFLFVDPEGYDMDEELDYYIEIALEFNPRAKSSRKK